MTAGAPTGSRPAVHVVVLNRNGQAVNEACLQSLLRSDYPRLTVWVADNASDDGSPEWIEQHFPAARVVRTGGNLGWSGGNNVGIRRALADGADYVWILNNDVEVAPDCIRLLIERAEGADRPAIVGPLIYYFEPRDRVWFEGGEFNLSTLYAGHCTYERFQALPQSQRYVSGCALMVRRDVFERIGLIDERFFIYYEDTDFCRRAALAGFRQEVERAAVMYHKVSAYSGGPSDQISPFAAYHVLRSGLLFWRRHLGLTAFHRRWCEGHLGKWVNQVPGWWEQAARRPAAEAIVDAVWYVLTCRRVPRSRPRSPAWFQRLMRTRPWVVADLMAWRWPGRRPAMIDDREKRS